MNARGRGEGDMVDVAARSTMDELAAGKALNF